MATPIQIPNANFENFHFSLATSADNPELIRLLRKNPIHMEMDYIMDKRDDFFKVHHFFPGSIVMIARNTSTNAVAGCLSLLKLQGRSPDGEITFQYITDLVKSGQEQSPLLMKKLLNFTFEQYFDTDFIFGLINAENKLARMFSSANMLHYRGTQIATFHYLEMVPLAIQKVPKQYQFRAAENQKDLEAAFDFINAHYQNHLLYRVIDLPYFEKMCLKLPDFSAKNVWLIFESGILKGAMICYNPSAIGSLIVAKMDGKTKFMLKIIRFIHRLTGLLFSPPMEDECIKTLQIRYLAGDKEAQNALLRVANNIAHREKLHSFSMLSDEKESPRPTNAVVYRYNSLLYAGYKPVFADRIKLFAKRPVFFDITFS
ncbi:MAG: hypothetical protein RIR11_961 [Bacteroidota bacterium]|jgi:hypothetical protein